MGSDTPTPAGGWVPQCLIGAFGDNGDIFCRTCVEADVDIQKRLELPAGDEQMLSIIADDDDDVGDVRGSVIALSSVQGIRCQLCERQIPEFPAHLRAMKGLVP